MRRACVVGHPVSHSRSPLIHGHWLQALGIEGFYGREDIAPADFPAFVATLADQGYVGCNVTVPNKEAAFAAAVVDDPAARRLGAANTLWLDGGILRGMNTDVAGFLANLDEGSPGWDHRLDEAVVLGAGGAARAIVQALLDRGASRIHLVNRTLGRAEEIAALFGPVIRPTPWTEAVSVLSGADILVNTTSLGMKGQPPLDLPLESLADHALVTDIVYVPLVTPILARAKGQDRPIVDGLGMLLHQAVPGFERWFGRRPVVTPELRALVEADILATSG